LFQYEELDGMDEKLKELNVAYDKFNKKQFDRQPPLSTRAAPKSTVTLPKKYKAMVEKVRAEFEKGIIPSFY
jgi:hypothetical protein